MHSYVGYVLTYPTHSNIKSWVHKHLMNPPVADELNGYITKMFQFFLKVIKCLLHMYNHAPKDYKCPLCEIASGKDTDKTNQNDVIYRDKNLTAFVAGKWWINNPGHIIIIPNSHFENIYDISDDVLGKIYSLAKKMAIVLKKAYQCDGTSTRQHNEPAGNQDVRHFHVHVFPRYEGDRLYELHEKTHWTTPEERRPYINKIKKYLK